MGFRLLDSRKKSLSLGVSSFTFYTHRRFCKGWDSVHAFYLALTCSPMITNLEHQKEERFFFGFLRKVPEGSAINRSGLPGLMRTGLPGGRE